MKEIITIILAVIGLIANALTLWSYGSGQISVNSTHPILGSPFIIITISIAVIAYSVFLLAFSIEQKMREKRSIDSRKYQQVKDSALGVIIGLTWVPSCFIWMVASWNILPSDPPAKQMFFGFVALFFLFMGTAGIKMMVIIMDHYVNDDDTIDIQYL